MGERDNITTKFRVDVSELKSGITEANKQIKLANAEFKAAAAGMDKWDQSTEGLEAKLKQLNSVLESEKTKLSNYVEQQHKLQEAEQENTRRAEELRQEYQRVCQQFGSGSNEARRLESALNTVQKEQIANGKAANDMQLKILNQQAAVNRLGRELENTDRKYNDFRAGMVEVETAASKNNRVLKLAESEFNRVAASMDDWRQSTEGLGAKLKQLGTVLTTEKSKLSTLEAEYQRVSQAQGASSREAMELRTAINNQQATVSRTEQEINRYNQELENLQGELSDSSGKAKRAKDSIGSIGNEAQKSESKLKGLIKGLGSLALKGFGAIGGAAAGAVAGFMASAEASREWNNDMIKLKQNAKDSGNSFGVMKSELRELTALTGETDSSIEALSNIMATGFSDKDASTAINALSGAVVKFPDTLKIESLSDSLEETIKTGAATGQFSELIGRMGYSVEDFSAQLEKCKTATDRQQLSLAWLNQSGLAKTNEEYQKANKTILDYEKSQFDLEDAMAGLGKAAMPLMTMVKEGSANLMKMLTPALTDVTAGIKGMADGTKGAEKLLKSGIKQLVSGAVGKLKELGPAGLKAAANLIKSIKLGVVNSIPEITDTLLSLAADIPKAFTGALSGNLQFGSQLANTFIQQLVTILPNVAAGATNLVLGLVNALFAMLPSIADAGLQLFNTLVDAFNGIFPILVNMIPVLFTGLVNILGQQGPIIMNKAIELFMGLVNALPKIVSMLGNSLPTIIKTVVVALGNAVPTILNAAITMFTSLVKAIPVIVKSLVATLKTLVVTVVASLIEAAPTILNTAIKLFMSLVKAVPKIGVALIEAFKSLLKTVKAVLSTMPQIMMTVLKMIIGKIVQWGSQAFNAGKNAGTKLVNSIINTIKNLPAKFVNFLTKVISKISAWGTLLGEKGKAAAKKLVDSIVNKITSLPDKMSEVGKNLVTGLWNGINNMTGWVKEKIKGFSDSILTGIKEFFDIHSPSRVMQEQVGKNIAVGTGEGVKKYTFKAVDEATKSAEKIVKASEKASKGKTSTKNTSKSGKKDAATEKRATQYKKDTSDLELKIARENASIAKQAEYWEKLSKKYAAGTEERTKAEKKYLNLKNKTDADQYKKDVSNLQLKIVKENVSVAKQAEYWSQLSKKYAAGSEQRTAAEKQYYTLRNKADADQYKKDVSNLKLKIAKENASVAKQAEYWLQLSKKYAAKSDQRKAAEQQYYTLRNKADADQYKKDVSNLEAKVSAEDLSAAEQLKLWDKLRKKYKKDSEEYAKADKKYNEMKKKARAENYSDDMEAIQLKIEQENLSAAEQLKLMKKLKKEYKQGTDERKKLDLEIAKTENEARKEKYDNLKGDLQKEKDYDRLSLAQEVEYWDKIRKQFTKGTEEREEAELEYYNCKKDLNQKIQDIEDEYNENVKSANEELIQSIEDVTQAYEDSVKSRSDAIANSMSLFDAFDYGTAKSGKELLSNLQSQVGGLEEWSKQLEILAARGVQDGLIDQLQEMGPSALGELKALNELTDDELTQYGDTWKKKNEIATQRAAKELENLKKETELKIQELTAATNAQLIQYSAAYNSAMAELGMSMQIPVNTTVNNMTQKGSEAVNNFSSTFAQEAQGEKMHGAVDTLKQTIMQELEAMPYLMVDIGQKIALGVAEGIYQKAAEVAAAAAALVAAANQAARMAANIHSPSRLFRDGVGKMLSLGMAEGITDETKSVTKAISDVLGKTATIAQNAKIRLNAPKIEALNRSIASPVNTGKTINYVQNIYSPKAVSRMDIRRQTKNALCFVN